MNLAIQVMPNEIQSTFKTPCYYRGLYNEWPNKQKSEQLAQLKQRNYFEVQTDKMTKNKNG